MGAFLGLDWAAAARQFFSDPVGCVSEPDYIVQEKGKLSADGERGGVWGVNVLSTYILVSPDYRLMMKALLIRLIVTRTPFPPHEITTPPPHGPTHNLRLLRPRGPPVPPLRPGSGSTAAEHARIVRREQVRRGTRHE